jgi:hypothetical protein
MSLWQLRDIEAVEQMRSFYSLYMTTGDAVAALAATQRDRIARLRRDLRKAPPGLWAPLIIQGRSTN